MESQMLSQARGTIISEVNGMKLSSIETFQVPPRWLFVRIETDDGAVGWGEASLEGYAEAVVGAVCCG